MATRGRFLELIHFLRSPFGVLKLQAKAMEEIRRAEAYYENLPEGEKRQAKAMEENENLPEGEKRQAKAMEENENLPEGEKRQAKAMEENENLPEGEKRQAKAMEEIRRAAEAYYENLPEGKKRQARIIFIDMDKNGDGQIDQKEYEDYLEKENNNDMALTHSRMFRALDKNKDGGLDFEEAKVLYYITQNERALFCKICNTFLTDVYFSCSQCFFKRDPVSTYEICCDCYGGKKFTHHKHAIFCDNYSLLSQSRSLATPPKRRRNVLGKISTILDAANTAASCIIM